MNGVVRRRGSMGEKEHIQYLDSLKSNKNFTFNTGIPITENCGFVIDSVYPNSSWSRPIAITGNGAWNSQNGFILEQQMSSTSYQYYFGGINNHGYLYGISAGNRHITNFSSNGLFIDNVKKVGRLVNGFDNTFSLVILCTELFNVKISYNDIITHNFIPAVLKKETGMYDTITETFIKVKL